MLTLMALWILAEPRATAECPAELSLSSAGIGPIMLGMTAEEIEDRPYPYSHTEVNLEGDLYPQYTIRLCPDTDVVARLAQDATGILKVYEVRTSSSQIRHSNGAHAGMRLSTLRALFPNGTVIKGYADGLYFSLILEDGGIFMFDALSIGEDCVMPGRQCRRDLGTEQSIAYVAR